jgi:stress-induced morphogen
MKSSKVRKSFRNFVLSRIGKSLRDREFLDVSLMASNGAFVNAHRFVLAGLSPLLAETLHSVTNYDETTIVLIPDFDIAILDDFVQLAYGRLDPINVNPDRKFEILGLCNLLEMCEPVDHVVKNDFVTVEDVERIFKAAEDHDQADQVVSKDPLQLPVILINSRDSSLNCPECPQKFSDEKELAFHQQANHQRPLTFYCAICKKPFDKETSLRHHKIAAHHSGTKVKLDCQKCSGKFTGKSALARHVAYCTGKTSLDCNICGKVYARKDNLVNHMARHSGVQLKCEHCNKTFRTSNDLYKHKKRLHAEVSGLKSAYVIACDQCGRKFTDKGRAYRDHLDYHVGIKNYECKYCDKKFATAGSLRDHASQHSGLATHACKLCGKEFKRVQNIRQHLIWTHKLENDDGVRSNIERLFLSGVDKLRALKEFEDSATIN